jgi:hypothetical protein
MVIYLSFSLRYVMNLYSILQSVKSSVPTKMTETNVPACIPVLDLFLACVLIIPACMPKSLLFLPESLNPYYSCLYA